MAQTIGLTGDVMLGRVVDDRQQQRPPAAVWGDLRDRLDALDGLLVNLECALSTRGRKWRRTRRPFHFRADPDWAVPAMERAGVTYASLANNHLLDFEEPALLDTLGALDDAGIAHAGAGSDRDSAWAPAALEIGETRIAVVSATDNTPEYAAGPDNPGVAHSRLDPDDEEDLAELRDAMSAAQEYDPDLLIASLHWGPNMTTAPSEDRRRLAAWLVDQGVDLVHGHSAHVFHGVEVKDGVPICYDCGDFVDDYRVDDEFHNDRSFLFEVTVDGGVVTELRLRPVEIRDCAVWEAPSHVAEWCRETMHERSSTFGTSFERDEEALVVDV